MIKLCNFLTINLKFLNTLLYFITFKIISYSNYYNLKNCNNWEKIGSLSNNKLVINNFRLVFWLQYNCSFNIKATVVLSKYFSLLKYIQND